MAKSKTKTDYINDLTKLVSTRAKRLTVKELRVLIAKYR